MLSTGPNRAARNHLGRRSISQRHRPFQGLRVGPQTQPIPSEAMYLHSDNYAQELHCRRLWPREVMLDAREEGHGCQVVRGAPSHPRLERAHWSGTAGVEAKVHGDNDNEPVYLYRMEMMNELCARSNATRFASRGLPLGIRRPTSTGMSTPGGATRRVADDNRQQE